MSDIFPHSCLYCKRYYPRNDRNNVMKGGGDCWSWSNVKGGEKCANDCQMFEEMDEMSIVQKSMYAVRAVDWDGDGIRFSFTDTFLHVGFANHDCETIEDGMAFMKGRIAEWSSYLAKCHDAIKPSNAGQRGWSKGRDENMANPSSDTRRRLNTILRGYPRNIQLSYRMENDGDSRSLKARLLNVDGNPSILFMQEWTGEFVPSDQYCSYGDLHNGMAREVKGEFYEFAMFMKSMGEALEKA